MDPFRSIIAWVVRLWLSSLRWRGTLPETTTPVVYCVWHRDVPAAGAFLRRHAVTSLVSHSKDGDLLVKILSGARMDFVRGSDSRGALSGTRQLLRRLSLGKSIATTWDGPKGPAGIRKPGAVWLSTMSGAPIVELRFSYGRHATLGDWSRLRVPFPGTTISVEAA